MITGVHTIIYSTNAKTDRDFFRKILKLAHIDVGDGWLIFGLPPSELAVHPSPHDTSHELYLMCDDINSFVQKMAKLNIQCTTVQNEGWGLLTQLTLPGGGKIGVYQPRHARPKPMNISATPMKKTNPGTKRKSESKLKARTKKK